MSSEFFNYRFVKTRKEHKCYDCGSKIEIGTETYYSVSRFDGYFCYGHFCNKCQQR